MRWIIFGGGSVVSEYHLPAFAYLQELGAVTIVDPSPAAIAKLKQSWPQVSCVQDTFQGYLETDVRLAGCGCIITVPNRLHEPAIVQTVALGAHCLCEKPVALCVASAEKIAQAVARSGTVFGAAMVRRFMPSFVALNKALQEGLIGEVQRIEVADGEPFAWIADSADFFDPANGGVLADMGIHYLDLLHDLFGELTPHFYEDDANGGVEANCHYLLNTKHGHVVTLELSRTRRLKNQFTVFGSKGVLYFKKDDFSAAYLENNRGLQHQLRPVQPFFDPDLPPTFPACFVAQLEAFQKAVTRHEPYPVSVDSVLTPTRLLEWAYESRVERLNQRPVRTNSNGAADRYFITGATGFIGASLIRRLAHKAPNATLSTPVRSYRTVSSIATQRVVMPRLDLLDYAAVKKQVEGSRYVVHLAYSSEARTAHAINVRATQNVVRAATECGAEAVVVLSTMYVYGHPETNGFVDETWPLCPTGGHYGRTKVEMQSWCLEWARQHTQTRLVLLNPSCVFGPEGKTYVTLPYDLACNKRFCWVDSGQGIANYVYIDNLLDAIEQALSVREAHGQNFLITDGFCSWREFLTPLLLDKANVCPNLTLHELKTGGFRPKTTASDLARYLLSDYAFVDLVNRHPVLGPLKSQVFRRVPAMRRRLDESRRIDAAATSIVPTDRKPAFDPPFWLADLFGPTATRFSAEKAALLLGWTPQVPFDIAMAKTRGWLMEWSGSTRRPEELDADSISHHTLLQR